MEFVFECVSSPTVDGLLGQLFVEMWSVGGVQKRSFLDLTQPNIGFAISAQNHLKKNM